MVNTNDHVLILNCWTAFSHPPKRHWFRPENARFPVHLLNKAANKAKGCLTFTPYTTPKKTTQHGISLSTHSARAAKQARYREAERHEQHHLSCSVFGEPLKPALLDSRVSLFVARLICETALSYSSNVNMQASRRHMGTLALEKRGIRAWQRVVPVCMWVFVMRRVEVHIAFLCVCVCSHSGDVIWKPCISLFFSSQ